MKKFLKGTIAFVLIISIAIGGASCNIGSSSERFDSYVEKSFLEVLNTMDILSLNYILENPEEFGVENFNINYGPVVEEGPDGMGTIGRHFLNLFFNYDKLTEDQKIIYDILKFNMDLSSEYTGFEYYYDYCSGSGSVSSYLLILLAEYTFYKEKNIDEYLQLLETTGDYFDEIVEYQKLKSEKGLFISDDSLNDFIKSCNDILESKDENILLLSFEERIEAFEGLDGEKKDEYIKRNEEIVNDVVLPAYEYIMNEMEKLRGTGQNAGGTAGFERGGEYYEYMAAGRTGSDKTVSEMVEMLENKSEECLETINRLNEKDATLYDRMYEAKFDIEDPVEILKTLEDKIKKDFPEVPDVNYDVKYVSKYMENILNPAFYLTAPIDNVNNNVIYINRAEKYKNMDIFTTLAHEGYPGHLYQSVYFSSKEVSPLRKYMGYQGYTEGWASYVEILSYDYGDFDDDLKEMLKANALYNLLQEALIDISINYVNKDYNWFKSLYDENTDEATIKSYYTYITDNPAVYLPYAVGCLEILGMRDYAKNELGSKFNLKSFHKTVLDVGPAPFHVVWDKVEKYVGTAASLDAA